ncbi:MAG TPA: FHA domain-containing protein, partial [Mycobacteriales bacterium]|nr:FHA domain-containing protein [Mycobacteriales bacterium]
AWREPRTRRLPLSTRDDVSLGRSRSCDCVIGDADVSRRHARLRHRDGRWWLADTGSANGTYVNGWRVTDELEVRPGDEVAFGHAHFILDAPVR